MKSGEVYQHKYNCDFRLTLIKYINKDIWQVHNNILPYIKFEVKGDVVFKHYYKIEEA